MYNLLNLKNLFGRYFTIFFAFLLFFTSATSSTTLNVKVKAADFTSNKTKYGFVIDDNFKPVYMSDFITYTIRNVDKGEKAQVLANLTTIDVALLQDQRSRDTFSLAYRVVMSPQDTRYKCGLFNSGRAIISGWKVE